MTFGEKLKEIRRSRNMTQDDFAKLLGTSKQVISRYELMQNTPKISVVAAWCKILNVSFDIMIDDDLTIDDLISDANLSNSINVTVLDDEQAKIAKRMREIRHKNNMPIESFANSIGVSAHFIKNLERGLFSAIRADIIAKLAHALGVSPAYLMGWEEETPAPAETFTPREVELVKAYRANPPLQPAVDKLLGLSDAPPARSFDNDTL